MIPHPDPSADLRWVSVSLMAEYTGLSRWTLWSRLVAGDVPAGCTKRFGRTTRWCPAAYFAETKRLAVVSP